MPAGRDPFEPRDPIEPSDTLGVRDRPGPRAVLARPAAAAGAPARELEVSPTRVGSPRSGRLAAATLGILVVVIAGALAVAQLAPPGLAVASGRPAGTGAGLGAAVGLPSEAPGGSGVPGARTATPARATPAVEPSEGPPRTPSDRPGSGGPSSPRLSPVRLRDRVRAGIVDEQLVFIDGALDVTPVPCQSLAQVGGGCVDLAIHGLGLPVWAGSPAIPWRGDPPRGAWLVTVARAGGLVYLGSLLPGAPVPDSVDQLVATLRGAGPGTATGTVFEMVSWLVIHPALNCYRPGVAATPCPPAPPFLATDRPSDAGVLRSLRGNAVDLSQPVVGVDRDANVVSGTFLVTPPPGCDPGDPAATCPADARWLVVARYDPARSVRVLVP